MVVAAVADLVGDEFDGLVGVSFGVEDGGEVEAWGVFVGRGGCRGFGGGACGGQVVCGEVVGAEQVGYVDDAAGEVLVDAVAVEQPGPAAGSEVVERDPGDQLQGLGVVGDAVGALGVAADPEPAEQVEVDQQAVDLVDGDPAGVGGVAVAGVGEVPAAGGRVVAEPVADDFEVVADPRRGETERVADLVGGGAVRPEREVGDEFGVVGLPFCQRGAVRVEVDGAEEPQPRPLAGLGVPGGQVVVQAGVGGGDRGVVPDGDVGGEPGQIVGGGGGGVEVVAVGAGQQGTC